MCKKSRTPPNAAVGSGDGFARWLRSTDDPLGSERLSKILEARFHSSKYGILQRLVFPRKVASKNWKEQIYMYTVDVLASTILQGFARQRPSEL